MTKDDEGRYRHQCRYKLLKSDATMPLQLHLQKLKLIGEAKKTESVDKKNEVPIVSFS
jgi:hypothetical protein